MLFNQSAQRTTGNSPAVHCWESQETSKQSVKRTAELGESSSYKCEQALQGQPSVSRTGRVCAVSPAMNRWAIFGRPLRGLVESTFSAKSVRSPPQNLNFDRQTIYRIPLSFCAFVRQLADLAVPHARKRLPSRSTSIFSVLRGRTGQRGNDFHR